MKSIGLKVCVSALAISVLCQTPAFGNAKLARTSIKARTAAFQTTLAAQVFVVLHRMKHRRQGDIMPSPISRQSPIGCARRAEHSA